MNIKATAGSVAAKQGYEYADNLIEYLNSYNTNKDIDKNLFNLCKNILKEMNINIEDIKYIFATKPLLHRAKQDLLLSVEYLNGLQKKIGISIKKGSYSETISFNNQSINTFLSHPLIDFNFLYPLAFIGLSKWLGLEPYKTLWLTDYGHENRPQGCYLLQELLQKERENLILLCTNKDFLELILNKIFVSNNCTDTEKADIILYPRIPNSVRYQDLVICNSKNLINRLLNDFNKNKNIIQNINPYVLECAGIRKKDKDSKDSKDIQSKVQNTIQFYEGLFHMKRKSSSGPNQTNILIHVNLKKLDAIQKIINKEINQTTAGKNTFINQLNFREQLSHNYNSEDLNNYILRSSPYNYELAKVNFPEFWLKNNKKFNFTDINEKDLYEGILYILGIPGYSPIEAFNSNKLEKINKNELLCLKSIPYYCLRGSIQQEIKNFFNQNIRFFLDKLIFNKDNLKGIIYNKKSFKETEVLDVKILEKEKILDYAVEIYQKQDFSKKTKSLNLGICYLKKYGGGGKNSSNKTKSMLALSLNSKGFDNLS